jgi:trehalose 6-phosphate phosphatase
MTDKEAAGVPPEAAALLDEHVHTFEHLEALLLFHREQLRDWTADEIADALETPADLSSILEQLTRASLIARRIDGGTVSFCYGPASIELAAGIECLAHAYEHHRPSVIRHMNANVISRVRSGAAWIFAESFVISRPPAPPPPIAVRDRRLVALFLDVDGTLLDFAPRPDAVVVPPRVLDVLSRLHSLLGGALALVSGRRVLELDTLFAPLRLPCAGVHGSERRDCSGQMHYARVKDSKRLDLVRRWLARFIAAHPGLLLEDKGTSLALHYRRQPELGALVEERLTQALAQVGDGFRIQDGLLVRELVPASASKGTAVEAFLAEPPFAGRMPVFIGDDLTDLAGFAAVEQHGGRAIAVGARITAGTRLPQPSAVIEWLEFLARADGRFA